MEDLQSGQIVASPSTMFTARTRCRSCESSALFKFLNFGQMPLAGCFPRQDELGQEQRFPLAVCLCEACGLVQLSGVVAREVLFRDYRYCSSTTLTLRQHFLAYAQELVQRFPNLKTGFVVEIGCNDGVLLKPLQAMGVRVLGVDPATNIVPAVRKAGIPVLNDFFGERLTSEIIDQYGHADGVCANNVFAHIDDLHDVMRSLTRLLKPDGVFVFEVHYLPELLEKLQYDMIYHEHLYYYAVGPLSQFFNHYDMEIFDVKRIAIHSGSIRVYARKIGQHHSQITPAVGELLAMERALKLDHPTTYQDFSHRVQQHKQTLQAILGRLKRKGMRMIGYGASGRANTLLNYCHIGRGTLDYLVDASPERYGRSIPCLQIPIVQVERMRSDLPDVVLMLSWSYREEILSKEQAFLEQGGCFLIPLPTVEFVPATHAASSLVKEDESGV